MTLIGITIKTFHIKCGFCGTRESLWDSPSELASHLRQCIGLDFNSSDKVAAKMIKNQVWEYASELCDSIDKEMEKNNNGN